MGLGRSSTGENNDMELWDIYDENKQPTGRIDETE